MVEVVITDKSAQACWKVPIKLLAHPPKVDDTITIEGKLQKNSSVAFTLKNKLQKDLSFKAYFTKDSSSDFAVSPSEGILKSDEDRGPMDNRFTVTFLPKKYGKTFNGVLIIETDDISWSFDVKGVPQKVKKNQSSRIGSSRPTTQPADK